MSHDGLDRLIQRGFIASLQQPCQIAVSKQPGQFTRFIDQHDGTRAPSRFASGNENITDWLCMLSDAAVGQWAHHLVDTGQLPSQISTGMKLRKVIRTKLPKLADNQGQGITERQHGGCACTRSQSERTGLMQWAENQLYGGTVGKTAAL